jgi:hypothetical protein
MRQNVRVVQWHLQRCKLAAGVVDGDSSASAFTTAAIADSSAMEGSLEKMVSLMLVKQALKLQLSFSTRTDYSESKDSNDTKTHENLEEAIQSLAA